MKKFFFLLLMVASILPVSLSAQQTDLSETEKANQYLNNKGEVYFRFYIQSQSDLLGVLNKLSQKSPPSSLFKGRRSAFFLSKRGIEGDLFFARTSRYHRDCPCGDLQTISSI